jgi:hypothetical protein
MNKEDIWVSHIGSPSPQLDPRQLLQESAVWNGTLTPLKAPDARKRMESAQLP